MKRGLLLFLLSLLAFPLLAARWRSHGPAGGAVRALVAAPSDARVLYVASVGGVFRSGDGGATWGNVSGPLASPRVLIVDPVDPNVVYAASSRGYRMDALFKTRDGGRTWISIGAGLPEGLFVTRVLVDPRDSGVVYVSTNCREADWFVDGGVFKSVDGGATFAASTSGMQGFNICVEEMSFDPLTPDTIYTTPSYSDSGYARSDDGARTWSKAPTIIPGGGSRVDPRDERRRWGSARGTLIASEDHGVTWTILTPTVLDNGSRLPWSITALFLDIDPAVPRLFFGGSEGGYRSGDGGHSVLRLSGRGREEIAALLVDAVTGALTIGTSTGVHRSIGYPWNDWTTLDTGDLSLPMGMAVPALHDPQTVYASSIGQIFVSRDSGRSWRAFGSPLPLIDGRVPRGIHFKADAEGNLFAAVGAYYPTKVFKLAVGTTEWVELAIPRTAIGALFVDPQRAGVVYVEATPGFLVTKDGGATWSWLFTPTHAYGLVIDPRDSNVLYASTGGALLKSTDAGQTWQLKTTLINSQSVIVLSPADRKTLYATGRAANLDDVLVSSVNGGESWGTINQPADDNVYSLAADVRDPLTVYASTINHGVFRSRNGGFTWESINEGLPNDAARLAMNADGTVLHAATGRGMWELPLTESRRRAVRP
jgi:photosystem II stability/assembly factor-like uncharacterized protein